MSVLAIDTLQYVKRLRAVGVPEAQAEVQAEALTEAVRENLVTKADVSVAVADLRTEITGLEKRLSDKIHESQVKLIYWLIPLMIGQVAAVAALVKLL
jgi:hypothetical protein